MRSNTLQNIEENHFFHDSEEQHLGNKIDFSTIPRTSKSIDSIVNIDLLAKERELNKNIISGQIITYEKATETLTKQIKELQKYFDRRRKSKFIENNENDSNTSILSSHVDKEIDRMLKVMPSFKGDSNDNFESWVLSVKNVSRMNETALSNKK